MSARTTALAALIACRKAGAWSDGVLREYLRRDGLDSRDAALATQLCCGVLQQRLLLDWRLAQVSSQPLSKLQPVVLDILRLGAYQIGFLDRVPVSAAVNEAVEQAKRYANARAGGYVNGVLRALDRAKLTAPEGDSPEALSIRYSHPLPLIELLEQQLPPHTLQTVLEGNQQIPPSVLRRNPLRPGPMPEQAQPHPWLADCWTMRGNVEAMPGFTAGHWTVQDAASQLAVTAAAPEPGDRVLDACAAPGGKSFACAARMQNQGEIIACDIHPHKIKLIEAGAERLGVTCLKAQVQDGGVYYSAWERSFDRVLADVPCSGLGIIRKKPDIRYKNVAELAGLPAVQARLLNNLSRYVKTGGVLLYSTCTILRRENEDIVTAFLAAHDDFALESFAVPAPLPKNNGMQLLLPGQYDTDGFFIARLRRVK